MQVSDRCGTTHKRTLRKHATLTRVRFDINAKGGVMPVGVSEHRVLDQAVNAPARKAQPLPVVVISDEVFHVYTHLIPVVETGVVSEEQAVPSCRIDREPENLEVRGGVHGDAHPGLADAVEAAVKIILLPHV